MKTVCVSANKGVGGLFAWVPVRFWIGILLVCLAAGTTQTKGQTEGPAAGPCSKTALAAMKACQHETEDDFWIAMGTCENLLDAVAREECRKDAETAKEEALAMCEAQNRARLSLCESVGEVPYDPAIDPAMFVDPAEIGISVAPNPYFPLLRGRTWIYNKGTETITVTVTDETKEILGVTCVVIHDVVEDNGEVVEDTKDWYGQDILGNVWYMGEIALNYEDGEVVSVEGSWTAGKDGAKPGLYMKAGPIVDEVYRQEFSLGNAEDVGQIKSLTGSATVPADSCQGDCLITRDYTPTEPGIFAHKYYKPGIGLILGVSLETGDREELVELRDEGIGRFGIKTSSGEVHFSEIRQDGLPTEMRLRQNYPNPFNPATVIEYDLPIAGTISLKLYDLLGREILSMFDGQQAAGYHRVSLDATNLASGIYFYRLVAGGFSDVKRLVVMK